MSDSSESNNSEHGEQIPPDGVGNPTPKPDSNPLVPIVESGNNQTVQIYSENNGGDNHSQHPAKHYGEIIKKAAPVFVFMVVCESAGLFLEHVADVFHGTAVELLGWISLCLQLLTVAAPVAIWVKAYGKTKKWVWIPYGILCFAMLLAMCSRIIQEPKAPPEKPKLESAASDPQPWLPPELPKTCKDVVIWFGGQGMIYPMQSLTNYPYGPEKTSVPITSLPSSVRTNLPNMPGFSPRQKDIFGILAISNIVNGKADIFYPVVPQVVSNRLYVFVKIPFTNYQQIVIGDQMDYGLSNCLPQAPDFWDWNYSRDPKTNVFEIVDANKNPIVQVIYKSPREVLVNGVFFVGFNDFRATFSGALPAYFSFPNIKTNLPAKLLDVVRTNQFGGTFPTNALTFGKHLFAIYQIQFGNTNLMGYLAGEDVYTAIATNQKPIFKYPSNVYPGEFAK